MTTTDRRQGLRTGLGLKAPCVVASTAGLTLSGEQTIDGIAVGSAQRVLVKDQADLKENGIYDVGATAWSRSRDFDGDGDAIPGTAVYVDRGPNNGGKFWAVNSSATSTSIVITTFVSSDADDKVWSLLSVALAGVSPFSQDTLFPLGTAEAWRSSDGLSAAPDPFGSTSVSSSAIITAGIADNAVTLAKLATGTPGALVTYSSTGVAEEIGPGSSGTVLVSNGASTAPTYSAVSSLSTASTAAAGVIEIATPAEMEAATDTDKAVTPGTVNDHPGAAKAWVVFTGTGTPTIQSGHNVGSITDHGTGAYSINFTTEFSSTNYVGIGIAAGPGGGSFPYNLSQETSVHPSSTAFRINVVTANAIAVDPARVYMAFYGDQ